VDVSYKVEHGRRVPKASVFVFVLIAGDMRCDSLELARTCACCLRYEIKLYLPLFDKKCIEIENIKNV